jgi:hypothetical protein
MKPTLLMNRLLILIFLFAGGLQAQNLEESIEEKVNQNMVFQLSKIPAGSEKTFGFDSRKDFAQCTAGKPIRVMTLDKDNALVELNEWRIPIMKDGKSCILFTARLNSDTIEIVDLGGVQLASELQTVLNNDLKYHFILRLFALHIDFVAACSDKALITQAGYIPLQSAKMYLQNKTEGIAKDKAAYTLSEVKKINKENTR